MRLILTVCILAVFTTACSKVPSQQSYPYSFQHKMQSADHWDELAEAMVKKQVGPYFTSGENKVPLPEHIFGVYIQDKDQSPFGIAFQTYLTTELFNKGIPISSTPKDCFTLEWSVQQVIHSSDRKQPGPPGGLIGAVVYTVGWVFGADFYLMDEDNPFYRGKVPHSELLVTLKVKDGNVVYSRQTATLYIDDADAKNYWTLPDREQGYAQSVIKKGTPFCRNASDLEISLSFQEQSEVNLSTLVSEGKCAIANQDYQVTLLEKTDKYLVIKHADKPNIYFTPRSSVGG
jgi:hypothetical protein